MSKANPLFSNPAFQRNLEPTGFNLVTQNTLNSTFHYQPLDNEESHVIEKLVWDNYEPGNLSEEETERDLKEIQTLTAEIKSIGRQGILLLGERVFKARDILKNYRNGTFTKWIEATFDSRKTGYNLLAYYELFTALPYPELKEKFKKIPQKAAYVLASRNGHLDQKMSIITDYSDLKASDLIEIIQERFPVSTRDRRRSPSPNIKLINSIFDGLKKIHKRKKYLTEDEIDSLQNLRDLFDLILSGK